jgi:hypothetical protein
MISSVSATGLLLGASGILTVAPSPIFNSISVTPAFLAARMARSISAWVTSRGDCSCRSLGDLGRQREPHDRVTGHECTPISV